MESAIYGENQQKLFGIKKLIENILLKNHFLILENIFSASYIDDFGNNKKSVLLASGFWGLARHMNYTFELITALIWCLPALLSSPIPYLYFIFLFFLLTHRTIRDDNRCSQKYGVYWDKYRQIVEYQMIPGIF
jgi:7-dehydrocholesterol reductase